MTGGIIFPPSLSHPLACPDTPKGHRSLAISLVSMLFADLLFLHLVTFLMFILVVVAELHLTI